MLLVRDVRPISTSWDLPQLTALIEGMQAKFCRTSTSRAAFLTALPDLAAGAPGAADAAALAFFKDGFPIHWTLRSMSNHGLSYCTWASGGNEISLSGELVDAWMAHAHRLNPNDKETEYRALCLEFILTTSIAHGLYHALEIHHAVKPIPDTIFRLTDGSRLASDSHCCTKCLLLWGGAFGATWRRSALLEDRAEDFGCVEGVFVEIMSQGRLMETRLAKDTIRSALHGSVYAPLDPTKLRFPERRPATAVVRRYQGCALLTEAPAAILPPWDQPSRSLTPPVTPPTLFYGYNSDADCEGEDEDDEEMLHSIRV
ncbi:hypothetical protein AURDEDRAFT_156181 [Auricularia subglabra TFB-10046 SS5]|nr:hypothetical protein AURDEDRAFT_156181 [Auricularia subglabra TFB-10046 SS5]